MYARERIIRDRFAKRSCGRCGAQYTTESVVILARRPSHWMVMVSCPHCSHRNVFLISFADADADATPGTDSLSTKRLHDASPLHPSSASVADADTPFASPPAPSHLESQPIPLIQPINDADVAAMHDFLQEFSGDFHTLFSTPRPQPHRKDDPSTT